MKRNLACSLILVMSLVLAACGSSGTAATDSGTDTAAASADVDAPAQGELSTVAKDILGILQLEGTDLAVDPAQAATLLPLWQAYRSLLKSSTAASAELEAVRTQIDEALTADQKEAIAAMNLTAQDMLAMAEELGVTQGAAPADGTDSSSDRPFVMSGGGPGGASGGVPPSGGAMPSAGGGGFVMPEGGLPEGVDPSMMLSGTPQAGQASRGGQGDRLSLALLDPLIELLKERAGS